VLLDRREELFRGETKMLNKKNREIDVALLLEIWTWRGYLQARVLRPISNSSNSLP
jgi:hypothetical protein